MAFIDAISSVEVQDAVRLARPKSQRAARNDSAGISIYVSATHHGVPPNPVNKDAGVSSFRLLELPSADSHAGTVL